MGTDTSIVCATCGRTGRVRFADCLAHGWPRCCGQTMRMATSTADIKDGKQVRCVGGPR